jgi:uncharacterized membrane protein YbhN (UPF0104 family)
LSAALAIAAVSAVIGVIKGLPVGSAELSADISRWFVHIPRWLAFSASVIAGLGAFTVALVSLITMLRHARRDAFNAACGLVIAATVALLAIGLWHTGSGVGSTVLHGKNPSTFVEYTAYIAFVTASDLMRRFHWRRWCALSALGLGVSGLALDTLTFFALLITFFGGVFLGWSIRWALGAASVRPSIERLHDLLAEHDIELADLDAEQSRYGERLFGHLVDGTAVEIQITSRDTRGAGLVRRLWMFLRLREGVIGHVTFSSRAQLEKLALASYIAQRADVLSPSVLLLTETSSEALLIVLALPAGEHPETPAHATSLFAALRSVHDQGLAHRALRQENLLVDEKRAGFSSLDNAQAGSGEMPRRLDLVQLLVTTGARIGSAEAIAALRDGYGSFDETALAAVIQPLALAPWGWSAMRSAQSLLTDLRHELLGEAQPQPIARLERFRWRTVLTTVVLVLVAYLFIGETSKVNLVGTLGHTNLGWFALALAGSALTYFAAAANLAAFVPKRLSPIRGFFVQLSSAFVGVAMPPTVGHIAVNARYLAREHVNDGAIAAAVALSQIVNVATTIVLMLIFGLLTGSGLSHFHVAPGIDIIIGVAVIAVGSGALLAFPRSRARFLRSVWPHVRNVWPRLLDAVSQPLRLLVGMTANLTLTFGYLVAFIASLLALGAHPALLPAAVVYLAGNTVGSAAPTPGGLGAVEAVLAAGLSAIGIPAHEAIPAVLVFRIATFWLPIPAGWLSYVALQRRHVL